MRISLVPAPTSSKGFQSAGSSPAWTFPNWKPASLREILWECQQIVVGRTYPTNLFFILHGAMYKIVYALAVLVKALLQGGAVNKEVRSWKFVRASAQIAGRFAACRPVLPTAA